MTKGCELLAGSDRLHYKQGDEQASHGCELLAGSDRLHFLLFLTGCEVVASCSRARIGYT